MTKVSVYSNFVTCTVNNLVQPTTVILPLVLLICNIDLSQSASDFMTQNSFQFAHLSTVTINKCYISNIRPSLWVCLYTSANWYEADSILTFAIGLLLNIAQLSICFQTHMRPPRQTERLWEPVSITWPARCFQMGFSSVHVVCLQKSILLEDQKQWRQQWTNTNYK